MTSTATMVETRGANRGRETSSESLEAGTNVKNTAIVGLERPRLQSIDVADFVRFKKKRQNS